MRLNKHAWRHSCVAAANADTVLLRCSSRAISEVQIRLYSLLQSTRSFSTVLEYQWTTYCASVVAYSRGYGVGGRCNRLCNAGPVITTGLKQLL